MSPTRFNPRWIMKIVREAVTGFINNNDLSHAAAMAFYAATALAPVLLIVLAVAGLVVSRDAAELALSAQLNGLIGPQGATLTEAVVRGAAKTESGIVATTVALVTLVVTASGVFGEMQSSLNQIWKVVPPSTSLSRLVRARAASLGLVASLGFLLLVSLAASAAISGFSNWINHHLPFGTIVLSLINTVVSLVLVTVLFAAIYKILPDRSLAWRDVRFGAVTTAILFTVGKSLIGWYLGTSAISSSYGAAGSLIVLLLWVFYSSCIFLLGAEITRAYTATLSDVPDRTSVLPAANPPQAVRRNLARPSSAMAAIVLVSAAAGTLAASIRRRLGPR